MQVGASFLSAALKKQTKSGFYIQLHVGSAATEPSSEMSSSSCMYGSVCLQLPCWRTSATNPVWRWLYPPSTAMLTAHLASPLEGITELEQKGSAHALVHLCRRLQVHLFTGMPFPVTISEDKGQNATLLLPQANTGVTHLLVLWAASTLCPQGTLLLSNTLLQMGKCQFPLCQD